MHTFVVYDSTGRILRYGCCSNQDDIGRQVAASELVLEHPVPLSDVASQYVVDGQVTERSVLPRLAIDKTTIAADGVDTLSITSLPNPTTVHITGDSITTLQVTDGLFEMSSEKPGTFQVKVDPFPSAVQEFVIDAV